MARGETVSEFLYFLQHRGEAPRPATAEEVKRVLKREQRVYLENNGYAVFGDTRFWAELR